MIDVIGINTRTCPHCGKLFVLPGGENMWAYTLRIKGKKKYLCSWGCKRAMERKVERDRLEQKHKNISEGAKRGWEKRRREATT